MVFKVRSHGGLSPQLRSLMWAWAPCFLGGCSIMVISPLLVSHCPEGAGSDRAVSLLLFPTPMWPFLYILSCRKPVLLVFRSFSEIVVLYVVVVLVCPWEGVSSGSSHFAQADYSKGLKFWVDFNSVKEWIILSWTGTTLCFFLVCLEVWYWPLSKIRMRCASWWTIMCCIEFETSLEVLNVSVSTFFRNALIGVLYLCTPGYSVWLCYKTNRIYRPHWKLLLGVSWRHISSWIFWFIFWRWSLFLVTNHSRYLDSRIS